MAYNPPMPENLDVKIAFIIAWFVQMGIHEGAHAWTAWKLGDDTAYLLGKRTIDPFRHINWNEFNSVVLGVVMPVLTALRGSIPMGMAWVPVNPGRFKRHRRDGAIVSAAGPVANMVLAMVVLGLHHLLLLAPKFPGAELAEIVLFTIYITSVVYGLFNALPLPPLDGSRVLYYFLPPTGRQVMEDIEPYGFWILIALFWFGSGGRILHPAIRMFQQWW